MCFTKAVSRFPNRTLQQNVTTTNTLDHVAYVNNINLRSAGVSGRTRRAGVGVGVNIKPPPPANSRTSGRSEAGEAAIESSQRVLFEGI